MSFGEERALETFKSLVSVSMEGLKALLLINGGAVVAVVAFLGQSTLGPGLAPHFWWPIALFVAGVVFCALAFLGSYFTQYSLYNEAFPARKYQGPTHQKCLVGTVLLALFSVACFAGGAFASVSVLANHLSPGGTKPASVPASSLPSASSASAARPSQRSSGASSVGP